MRIFTLIKHPALVANHESFENVSLWSFSVEEKHDVSFVFYVICGYILCFDSSSTNLSFSENIIYFSSKESLECFISLISVSVVLS